MNTSDKQFLSNSLKWMLVYIGISLTISFLVPFPASLVTIMITVFVINFIRRKLIMKNTGVNIKGMFSSTSSKPFEYSHVKYFCMLCGYQHKEISCPKCDSKMKRIG